MRKLCYNSNTLSPSRQAIVKGDNMVPIVQIDRNSSIPRYYQFKEIIKSQIEGGVLKEGGKIESEPDLIKKYGISSATIRKAFAELSKEGLVTRENGKGTFVNFSTLTKPSTKINKKITFLNYSEPDKIEYGYETSTFVMYDIQRGMLKESYKRKIQLDILNVFLINGKRVPVDLEEIIKDTDGVIFPHIDEYLFDKNILKRKPYIIVNNPEKDKTLNQVYISYEEAGFLAVEHLIKIGHKSIGFIRSANDNVWYKSRENGFRKAMENYHLPVNENWIIKCDGNRKSDGFNAGLELIKMSSRPTAIYVDTDWKALGVCEAILKRGLKIPQDIAVIGTDNIGPVQIARPSLSTIGVPREKQGAKAVEILEKIIKKEFKGTIQYEIKPKLIIRNSTVGLKKRI